MSATRYRQFALLLSAILRTTLLHGSDSATNSNNGNFLLSVSLADKPNKEFVPLTIGDARGSLRLDSLTNSSSGNSNALLLTVTKVAMANSFVLEQRFRKLAANGGTIPWRCIRDSLILPPRCQSPYLNRAQSGSMKSRSHNVKPVAKSKLHENSRLDAAAVITANDFGDGC